MLLGLSISKLMKTELYPDRASVSTFIMGCSTRRCQLSRQTESPHQQPKPQPAAAVAMADTATPTTATTAPGLVVAATDPIRSFLSSASASEYLAAEIRGLASALSSQSAVPYRSLRAIWRAVSPDARPPLRDLLQGTEFVLPNPKPRKKSAELKARLEKLREMQERREYAELVKDVVPPSKDDSPEPFSSYKDQIGFGLHVVVVMFTGYLVGFAAFRALFSNSPVLNAAGGILGLVGGMLVETVLFIIRSSSKELASSVPRSKKVQ